MTSAEGGKAFTGDRRVRDLLFERNPMPMWVADLETLEFLAVNEAAIAQYGYSREDFLRLRHRDIEVADDGAVPDPSRGDVRTATGCLHHLVRHRTRGGAILDVEVAGQIIPFRGRRAWLVTMVDVTERRRLEERLRQAQKLEAVGTLAGGIAHDFNNVLVAILGFGDLALDQLPPGHPARRHIEEVLKAGERAATLTHQLLAYSRRQPARKQVLDLNESVAGMEAMLRRLVGENIDLALDLDPGVGKVLADPGQTEQVLMNLVVNARDAMPSGGQVTIRTANVLLEESSVRRGEAQRTGRHAVLRVEDTGEGFDAATAARLFEPFFTTKEPGKGTGLGLATVYGIVRQHGGGIHAEGTPGKGAAFTVRLPVLGPSAAAAAPGTEGTAADPAPSPPADPGAPRTVLVAEDDVAVRSIAVEVLRTRGYEVLEAANGEEALRLAASNGRTVDLLLTDVVMPAMGGRELAARFRERFPSARVVFTTGYTSDPEALRGAGGPGASVLRKPFAPADLARAVSEALRPGMPRE